MKTIYAIPGLGTTKDLFKNIKIPNYELKILDWPTTLPWYTLRDYSSKFIEQIDCSYPVNLIGVSFGGMLCSELSNQIKTDKVVLISSCKDISEFPTLLSERGRLGTARDVTDFQTGGVGQRVVAARNAQRAHLEGDEPAAGAGGFLRFEGGAVGEVVAGNELGNPAQTGFEG